MNKLLLRYYYYYYNYNYNYNDDMMVCHYYFFSCDHEDDVKSLSLPGTYHEKISSLRTSLSLFTRLKSLDLSRNALISAEVNIFFLPITYLIICTRYF